MNGASAELWATTMMTATSRTTTIIGSIHHRLWLAKKERSSPAIPIRRPVDCMKPMSSPYLSMIYVLDEDCIDDVITVILTQKRRFEWLPDL
jgi:hypothetical protein